METLKHIIYINTCRHSSEMKDMITIYEQEQLEKYLTCKLLQAKRAEFFGEKIGSCTSSFAVSIQIFSSKYTEQEIKDYQLKFQGRSPQFKDFSRTNSFSRTFQGKPKIQGLFKDCGNPVTKTQGGDNMKKIRIIE